MSIAAVRQYFEQLQMQVKIQEFSVSSATVELAAQALQTDGARIAKTLSFLTKEGPVLIVAAGDAKVDNPKYKALFHEKAKMIPLDQIPELVGHAAGGVCPFALKDGVRVYLDESLRRFETVFPACGSSNSAVELTPQQLEQAAQNFVSWVDVCKGWQPEEN